MSKQSKHLNIKPSIDDRIDALKKLEGITYTEEVNRLLEIGLNNTQTAKEIYEIKKQVDSILKLLALNFELNKQIYADLNFPIKDIKTSESLNKFFKNRKGIKWYD
jgi:hypothetical protein